MKFGWINIFGAVIVILILIPNVIYALKRRRTGKDTAKIPLILTVFEQIGRYCCIILMWLPLFVWEFGFPSAGEMVAYLLANAALLIAYYITWCVYFKGSSRAAAVTLSVIPTVIFLLSGVLLRHWSLAAAAVIFGISHILITGMTHKERTSR